MKYLIEYFIRFKEFIGGRIYYLLALMLIVGFIEGFGITLFLPILQDGFGEDKISEMLQGMFNFFHISYSFSVMLAFIMVFFTLRAIFLLGYARYFGRLSSNLVVTLRSRVMDGVFNADYLYLLKKEIGYINNAMVREIGRVVDAFDKFANTLSYLIFGVIYLSLATLLNFKISIMIFVLSPALFGVMRRLNILTSQASLDTSSARARLHSILIQALGKFKYLKATSSHRKISKKIEEENKRLGDLRYKLFFLQSLTKDAFEPIVVFIVVGILFYYVVVLGKNVSEVIFLAFLFLQVTRQFLNVQSSYRKFLSARGSIETFKNFEKELEENRESFNPDGISPDFGKEISFKNVTLKFPNNKIALDNININIRPKSIVAFVGHSGSGKSSIANMLSGILRPTGGTILFGDTPYEKLNLKMLRENIGYVTQEDVIFNADIKNNIALWSESIDQSKLAKIIEMAHITGFVNDLPDKYDSPLGENGLDISGGQRQRITIARELYKEARLLILDEATSSLDSKSEKRIYENLRGFKGNKTMVVIAHRLSTIKNADYIYVLDEGKIAEEGAYEDLYNKKGVFRRMIDDQKLVDGE